MSKKLNIEDYIGKMYGKLTILKEVAPYIKPTGKKERKVLCKCNCGNEKEILLGSLFNENTKSCGCYKSEVENKRSKTHGLSYSLEYKSYNNMKSRCYNKNTEHYNNYGGRNIKVCDEWNISFEQFYIDMGKRPSKNYSLERKNVDGNYCKENCKWANKHEQAANTTTNNKTVGVYFHKKDNLWVAQLKVNKKYVLSKSFKTEEEAIAARKAAEIEYNIYN